eukprot:Sspe_Gene.6827::Locus_2295_Transcript_1_1_Confidence_1.000_Length_1585::g.6827::m.6827/K01593/DDC; aromatic-L-amino-acid decarboxylase
MAGVNPAELREAGAQVMELLSEYFTSLESTATTPPSIRPGDIARQFSSDPPSSPTPFPSVLEELKEQIIPGLVPWFHPRFMGYFPMTVCTPAVLAESITAAIGGPGIQWSASPAMVEVEVVVMDWMAKLFGIGGPFLHSSGKGGGLIHSTAGDALAAVAIAARVNKQRELLGDSVEWEDLFSADSSRLVAYMSDTVHFSSLKAARCAGLKVHKVPCKRLPDGNFGITAEDVQQAMRDDKEKGLVPCLALLAHGSTNTCGYDDVTGFRDMGIWVHVDAAYAGASWVLPEYQSRAKSVAQVATSFNVNGSKWLHCGMDSAMLWVRDRDLFKGAFSATADYLSQECGEFEDGAFIDPEFKDWGIPLGRRFRALRVWMVVRTLGTEGLQQAVKKGIDLADTLRELVDSTPGFAQPVVTDMGLVVLTVQDDAGEDITAEVAKLLRPSFFILPSSLEGRPIIRVALGGSHTETTHVHELWDLLLSTRANVVQSRRAA